jgi:hypothetical protein
MPPIRIHWSTVDPSLTPSLAPGDVRLVAVWPAPVNDDACFRQAGFTDFADADEAWDREADAFLQRAVDELSRYGPPRIREAAQPRRSWRQRLFGVRAPVPDLLETIRAPTDWDHLPDAVIDFGAAGATLRTGGGHLLLWITLPDAEMDAFVADSMPRIAAPHPLIRTDLAWEHLLPAALSG